MDSEELHWSFHNSMWPRQPEEILTWAPVYSNSLRNLEAITRKYFAKYRQQNLIWLSYQRLHYQATMRKEIWYLYKDIKNPFQNQTVGWPNNGNNINDQSLYCRKKSLLYNESLITTASHERFEKKLRETLKYRNQH